MPSISTFSLEGPEAVILEVMAKLEAGRTDFTDEEQTVVAKLLALTDSADAAIKRHAFLVQSPLFFGGPICALWLNAGTEAWTVHQI